MKYLLIIVALLVLHPAFCQQETPNCGFYGTKTVAERNALFPFNKAKKVVLVSYFGEMDRFSTDTLYKMPHILRRERVSAGKYEKVYDIIEEMEVTGAATDSLSNIMFNYRPKGKAVDNGGIIGCYDPRNAVLFYDAKGKLIAYLEICFMCGQAYFEPDEKIMERLYYVCPDLMDVLNGFFKQEGVTYGVEND